MHAINALGLVMLTAVAMAPRAASAQGASSVVTVTPDAAATVVSPGSYYTHVQVDISPFAVPKSDDDGRRRVGRALLAALGLGNKTRSITVTLKLSHGGNALPEIPLVTYSFDSSRRVTDYQYIGSYLSPRWQVGAASPIQATIAYRYSEQASYDPKAVTEKVSQIIPSDAIVTTLGGAFLQGVAGLAASTFQIADSRTVGAGVQAALFPYGQAVGPTGQTFTIRTPQGEGLTTIRAHLVVTPTLVRAPKVITGATAGDLKWPDDESVSDLRLNLSGGERWLMAETKARADYAAARRDRGVAAAQTYCQAASATFAGYGLTRMDRTMLIYQSLLDAGYELTDNAWLLGCFTDPADRSALTAAKGVAFTLAKPPEPKPLDPQGLRWPLAFKNAMGCWITAQTGPYCQTNAPRARASLEAAMQDPVRIGVFDLPGVDLSTLPTGRRWSRAMLLDAIGGKAQQFRCFDYGLVLVADGAPYTLSVVMDGDKITALEVLRAPPEAENCLPNS